MVLLNILISTFNERIGQVKNVILKNRIDVQYIVSHSYTDNKFKYIPEELIREDVIISQIPEKGVSHSMNNTLRMAKGDIGLFSDDDVTYTNEDFDKILQIFSEDQSLDVAIFKIKTFEGEPEYKNYPSSPMKLTKLPFSISVVEMAVRIDKIREKKIWFDERFGSGSKFIIGSEESVFILDCIKAGLNVWYFPFYIVRHRYQSTVKSIPKYDIRRVRVAGAIDSRINGWTSIPKAFYHTFMNSPDLLRHKKNPLIYLKDRLFTSFYILITKPDQ